MAYFKMILSNVEKDIDSIIEVASNQYGSNGVLFADYKEKMVDEVLQNDAYCGGNLSHEHIARLEKSIGSDVIEIYFDKKNNANDFATYLDEKYSNIKCVITEILDEDWNKNWKDHYVPIVVSDDMEIVPSWQKDQYESKFKNKIYIYPGQGFGTGSHETTLMCLQLFTSLKKNLKTCLDFGCGSGILGIASIKTNPKLLVDFYDIDDMAVENCEQNLILNDIQSDSYKLLLNESEKPYSKKYNLIFANILLDILLKNKSYLTDALDNEGFLILSGILVEQEEEVIKAYSSDDIQLLQTISKNDWTAFLFQRK